VKNLCGLAAVMEEYLSGCHCSLELWEDGRYDDARARRPAYDLVA